MEKAECTDLAHTHHVSEFEGNQLFSGLSYYSIIPPSPYTYTTMYLSLKVISCFRISAADLFLPFRFTLNIAASAASYSNISLSLRSSSSCCHGNKRPHQRLRQYHSGFVILSTEWSKKKLDAWCSYYYNQYSEESMWRQQKQILTDGQMPNKWIPISRCAKHRRKKLYRPNTHTLFQHIIGIFLLSFHCMQDW